MTNNEVFLKLLIVAFIGVVIISIFGIGFALGAKGESGQNNKLSMLVSVLKYNILLCCILSCLSVVSNALSNIVVNNFKKEVIKYQQNINPDKLNKFVFMDKKIGTKDGKTNRNNIKIF
jgi:hypothetical protein